MSHLDSNLYLFRLPIMIELVEQGYEVYAIIPEGKHANDFKQYNIKTSFYHIDRKSLNIFKEIKTIYSIYNAIKGLDLDIVNSFMLKPNIYASISVLFLKMQKYKIKLICAITGLGSFYVDNDFKSKLIKYLTQFLYKISFLNANKVIFQNNDDLSLFVQKNIVTSKKTILIRSSGINTSIFNKDNVDSNIIFDIKNELDIKPNEIIVLMVARLIIHKGVREYIQTAQHLSKKYNSVRFLLIGDIDKGSHFNVSQDLLQDSSVELIGQRSNIKEYISLCDIFVLPSYREGVPRTLLEAGAMGKPLVSTNAVGCKEVVEHNFNGFLATIRDSKSLIKYVEKLIIDEDKRTLFGQRSLKLVQKEFDVKHIVKSYIDTYESIL